MTFNSVRFEDFLYILHFSPLVYYDILSANMIIIKLLKDVIRRRRRTETPPPSGESGECTEEIPFRKIVDDQPLRKLILIHRNRSNTSEMANNMA